jgi:hypothetical protein
MSAARLLLAALAVSAAVPGLWATVARRSFFDDFPGPGAGSWVAELPPFNAHLTSDVGAFYLAFALLFAWAAARPHPALVVPLAVAWSLFSLLHLLFHVTHLDGFGAGDGIGQTATLALVLAAGVALVRLGRDEPG